MRSTGDRTTNATQAVTKRTSVIRSASRKRFEGTVPAEAIDRAMGFQGQRHLSVEILIATNILQPPVIRIKSRSRARKASFAIADVIVVGG